MRRPTGFVAGQQHVNARQQAGAKDRNYRPKFCRTRGCNLPFGHPGNCPGTPSHVEIPTGQGGREQLRAYRRGQGRMGENHRRLVKRSPKAAPIAAARIGMARIRNHEGHEQ